MSNISHRAKGAESVNEVQCKITRSVCSGDACVLWLGLEDAQGCIFALAERGIKETMSDCAKRLDRILGRKGW